MSRVEGKGSVDPPTPPPPSMPSYNFLELMHSRVNTISVGEGPQNSYFQDDITLNCFVAPVAVAVFTHINTLGPVVRKGVKFHPALDETLN